MFFDTDCGGVVSNIAYLRFIEIARTHLAEELGLAVVEMAQKETYPVVVRTEIDYRRAAKLGDRLTIEGWLDRTDRARFWCAFRITRSQDDALIAECRQMLALIEMPTGKLLRLPEHWKTYDKIKSSERRDSESRAEKVRSGESVQ
jgi:YbgC/YbaW family acyl-CoA thioester hydrolase